MSDLPTINIHNYDGGYRGMYTKEVFCPNSKRDMFAALTGQVSAMAGRVVAAIHKDSQLSPNYDNTDDVFADDLLASLCWRLEKLDEPDDMIRLLDEQFCDLVRTNGWCPQGRCTRVWQVLHCLL